MKSVAEKINLSSRPSLTVPCFVCIQGRLIHIYLNAKVSQHLLKCQFLLSDPNISLGDNVIDKSLVCLPYMKIITMRLMVAELQLKKFEKSQSYNTLHVIRKRFLTSICLQKQKDRQIKPGLFYVFVKVHFVNVNPSIFDVICRLNTTVHQ